MECQRRMRFNAEMNRRWAMGIAGLLACGACSSGEWTAIPRSVGPAGGTAGFEVRRRETTVAEFLGYLNGAGVEDYPETAQIARRRGGGYAAKPGAARQAVSEVAFAEAEAYGRWLSGQTGRTVRLPTEAEWEAAARGGVDGAPFPWGWGGKPSGMARFDAEGPAPRGGTFPANGFGLYDVAGNLYEWCGADSRPSPGRRVARGGSWAERDPARLAVAHRQFFPADYRGRDVGFRVLREAAKGK